MKKFLILIIILLAIIFLLFIGKNLIAKTAVEGGVKAVTGLQMDIGSLDVGILNTLIDIRDMKLYNPPDYPEELMIDMPEIFIDYDLNAFLKRKVHLETIRINLRNLTVIKDKNGKLNIDSLKMVKEKKKAAAPVEKEKTKVKIDLLELKIGKVAYKDFSKGSKPIVKEFDLDINERFQNISDLDELGKIILLKALTNTNIANLTDFDLGPLKSGIADTIKRAGEIEKPLKEVGEKTGEALKETADEIKKKLKLPFGK